MKKTILSALVAATLMSGSAFAAAVTTTTTWTDEQGNIIREHSTVKHYSSINDPKLETRIGVELPQTVTLYDLPDTIKIEEPRRYSYVIVNDHPVVVERSTRRVIHAW